LNQLDRQVCWEDSETVEYYAKISNEDYFPFNISRSGYVNKNIHILCQSDSSKGPYLEMVLIDCDHFSASFAENITMNGRVDALKRIEIYDYNETLQMRCSRMIYRFLTEDEIPSGNYFKHSKSIK
jgi:hypothetical protein